jgi:hypothetical protein
MKLFSANIEDLHTLYVTNLKKALDMEQKITRSLPDLIEKSTDTELANAFRTHLEETRGHVQKVESLLRELTGEANTETCKVIGGLSTSTTKSRSTEHCAAGPDFSASIAMLPFSKPSKPRKSTPTRSSPTSPNG